MKFSMRPPTLQMIEKLKECYEKEMISKSPSLAEEMKSSLPGLYKRGLIDTRLETIKNKKLLCIYVTDLGKRFLADLEEHKN